jgi:hypothetical protein
MITQRHHPLLGKAQYLRRPARRNGRERQEGQIIRTDQLGPDLVAVPDAPPPGHVSIRPRDMTAMPDWQATRPDLTAGTGLPHPYVDQVRQALAGEVKRARDGSLIWPEGWEQP